MLDISMNYTPSKFFIIYLLDSSIKISMFHKQNGNNEIPDQRAKKPAGQNFHCLRNNNILDQNGKD